MVSINNAFLDNQTAHPKMWLQSKHKLRCLVVASLAVAALPLLAFADEITFSEGHWAGQPIPNDPSFACHMGMQLDENTTFLIHANADGEFNLGFFSNKWNITQEKDIEARLEINDQPVTFTRVFLSDPKMIVIKGATVELSRQLSDLMSEAETMYIAFKNPNYKADTTFYDNHLAVAELKNCIKSAQRAQE